MKTSEEKFRYNNNMEDIVIKEGPIEEVLEVLKTLPEFDKPFSKEYFEKEIGTSEKLILLAYIQKQPVGFIVSYDKFQDGSLYCWWAGVDPKYRQKGILTKLMEYQDKWAKGHGFTSIKIKTINQRRAMLAYLVKSGFEFTRVEEREDISENRIYLEKNL